MTQRQKSGGDSANTRVITPDAILSYPHVFDVWAGKDGTQKPSYSATFIFVEGTDLTALKAAVVEAGRAKWANDLVRPRLRERQRAIEHVVGQNSTAASEPAAI